MNKPRFECESCGADQETFTCNGRGCGMRICLSCIKRHEPDCIERCGDRTKSQPKVQAGEAGEGSETDYRNSKASSGKMTDNRPATKPDGSGDGESARDQDVFDLMGHKIAKAVIETAKVFDGYREPFRSGAICGLEELWVRLTGHFLDWEDLKEKLKDEDRNAERS